MSEPIVPNVIHFVFGVTPELAGRTFTFIHYLAVVTAWAANRPDHIYLHCQFEPFGIWWDRARRFLNVNHVQAPDEVFGNPVTHPAHKADVIRLDQLLEKGGIYLDLDVVCVRSFGPLRNHAAVLAREGTRGLCNAVILAAPNAEFLRRWRDSYRDFDGSLWGEHSVIRPLALSRQYPEQITVLPQSAFFFPMYSDPPNVLWMSRRDAWRDPDWRHDVLVRMRRHASKTLRFKKLKRFDPPLRDFLRSERSYLRQLKRNYCIHLWRQMWWDPYLKTVDPRYIVAGRTNFARIINHVLRDTTIIADIRRYADEARTSAESRENQSTFRDSGL